MSAFIDPSIMENVIGKVKHKLEDSTIVRFLERLRKEIEDFNSKNHIHRKNYHFNQCGFVFLYYVLYNESTLQLEEEGLYSHSTDTDVINFIFEIVSYFFFWFHLIIYL